MISVLAPVTFYVAIVGLCLAATHRWIHRLSRAAAVVLALLPLAFAGPALLTGDILAPIDELYAFEPWESQRQALGVEDPGIAPSADLPVQIIPWHAAVRWSWSQGEWPLWNPFMLAGDTLQQCAQPAPYHPLNLLALALPLAMALTPLMALTLFVAALSAFCWCREIECSESAAMLGAAAFMASGFFIFWLLWPLATTWAAFPLLTTGLRRMARSPGAQAGGILTVSLALQVLGGHPESTLHGLLAAIVYGLYELAATDRQRRLEMIAWGALAAVVAAGLTAIFWLPLLDAMPQSWQFHQRSANTGTMDDVSWDHARGRLLVNLIPFRFGQPWSEGVPTGFFLPTASAYVGSCLLGLGLFGLWRHPWRGRFVLAAFAAFAAAAGASVPLVVKALEAVPLLSVAVHRRWTVLGAWAIAGLVALGAEAWRRQAPSKRPALCQLAVLTAAGVLVFENWQEMRAGGLSQAYLSTQTAWLLIPGIAALAVLAWPSLRRHQATSERLLWVLLICVLSQRVGESGERFVAQDSSIFYPRPEILDLLPQDDEPSRFVATGEMLVPNTGVFWGLEDVRGYQPLRSALFTETYPAWPTQEEFFINRVQRLDSPILDFLGVRFAVLEPGIELPKHWRLLGQKGQLRAALNTRAAPRAFVPSQIVSGESGALERLAAIRNFREVSMIHQEAPLIPPKPVQNGPGTIQTTRRGTALKLEATMDAEGWMVVSETAWRGWKATATDGRRFQVSRANHAFLAVHLPAGHTSLELRYLPRSFQIGRTITFTTLLLLGSLFAARIWARRPENG